MIIHLTALCRIHASLVTLGIVLFLFGEYISVAANLLLYERKIWKSSALRPAEFYLFGGLFSLCCEFALVQQTKFFTWDQLITSWMDSSRLPPQNNKLQFGSKKEGPERWQLEGQEPDGPSHPINAVWGWIKENSKMCHVPVMGQTDFGERVGVTDDKCW